MCLNFKSQVVGNELHWVFTSDVFFMQNQYKIKRIDLPNGSKKKQKHA